ncbi:ecdysone receptor-like isoform X2 [Penaeus chinensis]|uniref:ecdysone receptor-like isoform X2 n=1 Tax=Penaeus chinensis TaxID=139456 RepID=UPI001FB65170|nr:ecdysone receptor-like isoform X2 [Penaeus chinensis]
MTMDFPRKSSRGRGMLGPRPPQTHAMANTLVSPRMDHSPSDSFMDGSPLGMGVSPLGGRPRSPMSPGDVAIKTEPPLSPTAKRPRPERVDWAPSPSTLSMESLSPPSFPSNGMGAMGGGQPSNAGSPLSSSSYDPSSPYPPRSVRNCNGVELDWEQPDISQLILSDKPGREDMSSPSSYNGYGTESSDYKKKKGPVPRQQEELCLVCGDRASGYHYNALTCEGCKGFFRRSITKNAVYQCKYGHNCEMDMYMRRKCQECRLKKCLNVGMRPECVVPESQCQVKREQKKARGKDKKEYPPVGSPIAEEKFPAVSPCNTMGPSEQRTSTSTYYNKLYAGCISLNLSPVPQSIKPNMPVPPMTSDQEELISALVHYQEEFEQPSEADIKRIQFCFEGEASDMKFKEITEMTLLTVQLIVEFSKQLPGFSTLQQEDKISLLKACSSEVMMLRAARRYDAKTNSIVFGNSYPYTESEYETAGLGFSAPMLFRFCRNMCRMKVDNAEYALLAAMSIFSADRPFLREAYKVQKLQEIYLNALIAYVANKRALSSYSIMIGKLLNVLTELRTLGNLNSEMCYRIQLTDKRLPDLLNEIWDVTPK